MEEPAQWQRIKEIVGAALEREPSERAAFLDEACSQDAALRAEVDSLISAYANAGPLSEAAFTTEHAGTAQIPQSIGPSCLLQKLGEGGMGQVWLAEQTQPVRRKVAHKLIRSGMYDAAALRRFQSERQSLAIMEHPAIARFSMPSRHPMAGPTLPWNTCLAWLLPITATRKICRFAGVSNYSFACAKGCSTRTRKPSFIAI